MGQEVEKIRVFITKYALTQGIFEREVETCPDINDNMVADRGKHTVCYHKPDWYRTLEEAQARVEVMLKKRRAALEKQLKAFAEVEKKARAIQRL